MSGFIAELAATADSESPREQRANLAAQLIRDARQYRWVGIYDVDDDEVRLIGGAGERPASEAARSRATVIAGGEVVVPILGAESGIVIGTIDARSDGGAAPASDDVAFLEDCAAALRPLYD